LPRRRGNRHSTRWREDEVIAALLHDAVEDQGGLPRLDEIRENSASASRAIVDGCTDSYELSGEKRDWGERKRAYIEKVAHELDDVRLVSAADNWPTPAKSYPTIRAEGDAVFKPLHRPQAGHAWYYRTLVNVFRKAGSTHSSTNSTRVVTELEHLAK